MTNHTGKDKRRAGYMILNTDATYLKDIAIKESQKVYKNAQKEDQHIKSL